MIYCHSPKSHSKHGRCAASPQKKYRKTGGEGDERRVIGDSRRKGLRNCGGLHQTKSAIHEMLQNIFLKSKYEGIKYFTHKETA